MMPLPLPVRLAAGLVATAVEQARDLPRLVVEFPVTAVSQALQVSMRMQQRVTELAIKGDRALGALRPVEERPSWATFDDDEPPHRNGASTVTELRPPAPPRVARPIPVSRPESPPSPPAPVSDEPPVLPGYAELSIPQLRAKLRTLSPADLRALLAWEQAHDARPPYVTMLTNRITTVTEA
ncbi:lipid droplet-associated protein [Pseudonocardia sp.]|uniref:lipid droplet-associated protein n=1 Tax=Pseudonocardia sp. TaxID=60912 RepID=UPI00261E0727|nr:lipid droplet-associated protein [Pseudonocardia sp.]